SPGPVAPAIPTPSTMPRRLRRSYSFLYPAQFHWETLSALSPYQTSDSLPVTCTPSECT
ncbi:hypothetical protein GGI19_005801, partial [Coemansia pectinata]